MVEIKSVKVDNWGVFFLQKLQNFFNKTDYCDLTLQFKDNSQLKVHRLVLSACTDFFNVLENRYAVNDDILIMPKDLQADVVVPIVNFMYTGTLEFEVNMYQRLLKTAKEMNMTVLLKLLDAHKRTVGEAMRAQQPTAPVLLNKGATGNQRVNTYSRPSQSQKTYQQVKKTTSQSTAGAAGIKTISPRIGYQVAKVKQEKSPIRSIPSTSFIRKNLPEPVQLVAKYANSPGIASIKGPSRFECSDDVNSDAFESSFDNISYESKPLITSKDDQEISFDKIKRTVATKRPFASMAPTSVTPPPEKKPNIEDVKEYTEAARLRKEIVAQELEEDPEYYEDEFQNDDDDDDNDNENASVVIKSESGSQVNHAKILSEVVKKYPHLLKNNKNIKLKILQKGNSPVTVSAVAKDPSIIASSKQQAAAKQARPITVQAKIPTKTEITSKSSSAQVAKPTTPTPTPTSTPTPTPTAQPKKIDSRTMYALIAKGAENTTGPWLCLECGVGGRPISIPSYKGFRRHLINTHKQKIDPRLCEHCGHRSIKRNDLHYHLLIKHKIQPPQDLHFPKCGLCIYIALDQNALKRHKEEDHQTQSSQQLCIYCNKTFQKEIQLYTHMRNHHRERAIEDGVIDFSDDETYEDESDKYVPNHPEASQAPGTVTGSKIKVLSNITLPSKAPFIIDSQSGPTLLVSTSTQAMNLEPSSEAEGLSNVASGIATSMAVLDTNAPMENVETYEEDLQTQYIEAAMADVHGEILKKDDEDTQVVTKFITEEGSELELTADQKARLLEQLQDQSGNISDNVVMVLEDAFEQQSQDDNNAGESMELEEEGKPENESTEWDESHHEQSDDPLKNDDSGGAGTEDDEMASTENENASVDEDSQGGESEVNEHETVQGTEKENSDKSSNKLISALEGDWTEEDDEAAEEPTESTEDVAETEKPNGKHVSKQSEDPKTDKTNENKDLILEDWDSQQGDKNDSIEDEKVESDETVKIVEDKHTNSVDGDTKNIAGPAVGTKKQLAQKNDLKTLINDWDNDEDDDGF